MFPYQSIKVDFLMPQSRKIDLIRFRDSELLALKASLLVYFHTHFIQVPVFNYLVTESHSFL